MRSFAKTHPGQVRKNNQDVVNVLTNDAGDTLAMVCDGMGGHLAGDVASAIVNQYFKDAFAVIEKFQDVEDAKKWLSDAIYEVNNRVKDEASLNAEQAGMGTTLVASLITDDNIIIANVGDSRCYGLKDGLFKQLTEDQTLVNMLVKTGLISAEDALVHPNRNVLMSAVGIATNVTMDTFVFPKTDMILLHCSDGLYNLVSDSKIEEILSDNEKSIENKVDTLIDLANAAGGTDNISVAIVEIEEGDLTCNQE